MEQNFVEKGWQCPVCGAVMSPRERVCVNCTGNANIGISSSKKKYLLDTNCIGKLENPILINEFFKKVETIPIIMNDNLKSYSEMRIYSKENLIEYVKCNATDIINYVYDKLKIYEEKQDILTHYQIDKL